MCQTSRTSEQVLMVRHGKAHGRVSASYAVEQTRLGAAPRGHPQHGSACQKQIASSPGGEDRGHRPRLVKSVTSSLRLGEAVPEPGKAEWSKLCTSGETGRDQLRIIRLLHRGTSAPRPGRRTSRPSRTSRRPCRKLRRRSCMSCRCGSRQRHSLSRRWWSLARHRSSRRWLGSTGHVPRKPKHRRGQHGTSPTRLLLPMRARTASAAATWLSQLGKGVVC